jgi:putative spermidine/putrescine transport system ATP-binding protein
LTEPAALVVDGVRKSFGAQPVVQDVSLTVAPGEFLTLLGPSGCGKTTTLNLIAGFLRPDSGNIRLDGREVTDVPVFRRGIGMVFQDYALFPHRTVAENVAFGLRMRRVPRAEIAARVAEALALVQLSGLDARRPGQLSGGQRQRVALARALVIRPAVLLLDEPLSNLDLKLREDMRLEISGLQRKLGITTVLVTHDQGEALVMSDRVAVMRQGRVVQIADPATIYDKPADRFVAEFIGTMNLRRCRAEPGGVRLASGPMPVAHSLPPGTDALLAFRPERVRLGSATEGALALTGRLDRVAFLGGRTELHVMLPDDERCLIELTNDRLLTLPKQGDMVAMSVSPADCLVYPA